MNLKKTTVYAWLTAVLVTVSALSILDIYLDLTAHLTVIHAVIEVVIVVLSLAPAFYLLHRWKMLRRKALDTEQQLQDYLEGIGRRIEQEFSQWNLTEAEKKTAIYILKGMSHREIASQCHRSEGTVRQHAVSVYRKAGLTSRAEFSAYFLQMLLAPLAQQVEDEKEGKAPPAALPENIGDESDISEVSGQYKVAAGDGLAQKNTA